MKLRSLGYALILASVALSGQAFANGKGHGHGHKPQPLEGCYQVVGGVLNESLSGGVDSVGTYQMVLEQESNNRHKRKRIELSGPFAGREDLAQPHEEGEEGEEGEEEHGKHTFGTYNRSGAFWGHEIGVGRLGQDCFNPVTNRYDIVHFFEIFEFHEGSGTGAYSGISDGDIRVEGTLDRCTDPNNVRITFKKMSGELCFGGEGEGHED